MTTTIGDLLFDDPSEAQERLRGAVDDVGLPGVPRAATGPIAGKAVDALGTLLATPVSDVLWWAAESQSKIEAARRRTVGVENGSERVTLHQQHFESRQRSHVTATINGTDWHLFDLDLRIELVIDSLVAEVRAGHVDRIRPGSARSEASLDIVDSSGVRRVRVFEHPLGHIDLA